MTRTVTITDTEYEGNDFPEAEHWHEWLAGQVSDDYAGVLHVTVKIGVARRVTASGFTADVCADLERDIMSSLDDYWEAFCTHGYTQYADCTPHGAGLLDFNTEELP